MRTSVLKSSSVDARSRSTAALESKHAPDLGIPEAALPQAAPPAELVALQRLIANRPEPRPVGAPAPAVSVQRDAGTGVVIRVAGAVTQPTAEESEAAGS